MAGEKTTVRIVPYHDDYQPHFERLNLLWIEEHFTVEAADLRELQDPRTTFLVSGGQIFFVEDEGAIVGTCGLPPRKRRRLSPI